ncbi:MAG: FtsQ-type POTRA domain-containing protein [Desulfovibrio sp.]|nr:MAG: FtsQ-type POTRA domain-containing protein [Desulfovibrio sp.]
MQLTGPLSINLGRSGGSNRYVNDTRSSAKGRGNTRVKAKEKTGKGKTSKKAAREAAPKVKQAEPRTARTNAGDEECVSVGGRLLRRWTLLTLAGLALVSVGLWQLYSWTTNSQYFAVKEVVVQGEMRLDAAYVAELAGIQEGGNSLAVNMQAVEARLAADPWIEKVTVTRELPDRFHINIVERMPSYWVSHDDQLWYADRFGSRIGPVNSENFTPYPVLMVEEGGEALKSVLADLQNMARNRELPFNLEQAAWVRLSAGSGVEVHFENKNLTLSLDPADLAGSAAGVEAVLGDLEDRGEGGRVRAVHVVRDRVYVSLDQEMDG